MGWHGVTDVCSTLEDNDFMARSLAVREGADSLRGLVLEACEHLVEVMRTELLEKPFSWKQE